MIIIITVNKKPLVTAIVTIYNRPVSIVRRALMSVIKQSYANIEIILVNDCPEKEALKEELYNLVTELSDDKKIIKYIVMSENGGACKARNEGIKQSNGEYIACLDDDDEWFEKKIELQVNAIDGKSEVGLVYCNARYCYLNSGKERDAFENPQKSGNIYKSVLGKNIGSCSFILFKKENLVKVGGFNEEMPAMQDWEAILMVLKCSQAAYIHEPLIKYYFYEGERISNHPERRYKAYCMLYEEFKADLNNSYPSSLSQFYSLGSKVCCENRFIISAIKYWLKSCFYNPINIRLHIKDLARIILRIFCKPKIS